MLFDIRVSRVSRSGCEHRQHGGVKQVEMRVLETISKYFDEKNLPIQCKYIRGKMNMQMERISF